MKKLLTLAVVAAAMMSCSKTETLPVDSQEIRLTAGVMQMVGETKAVFTGTSFANDTEIGMYGLKDGADWTDIFFENTGTKITDDAIVFTNKVYYPQDNSTVKFFAFYPKANPVVAAGVAPTVAYDLSQADHPISYGLP